MAALHNEDSNSPFRSDRDNVFGNPSGRAQQDKNTNQIFIEENGCFPDDKNLQGAGQTVQERKAGQSGQNGPNDINDKKASKCQCCTTVNITILIYKGFYFFFFAAIGSLIPFLSVFYKQIWLSARQTGVLLGISPLINMVTIPMWGVIADLYKKSSFIFIFSLMAWLVTYYSISLVSPVFHVGFCQDNNSVTLAEDILDDLIKENRLKIYPVRKVKHFNTSTLKERKKDGKPQQRKAEAKKANDSGTLLGKTLNNKTINKTLDKGNNITIDSSLKINHKIINKRMLTMEAKRNRSKKVASKNNTIKDNFKAIRHKLRKSEKLKSEILTSILSNVEFHANKSVGGLNASNISTIFTREQLERIFDYLNMQGHYPWPLDTIMDYKKTQDSYEWQRSQNSHMFTVLLVMTAVGTLFSSPSCTLADIATLQQLDDHREDYGKQRLWGSIGWGLGAFVIGACISTIQELHNCNNPLNVDYMPCFYSFAILMGIAILIGFLFNFDDTRDENESFLKGFSSVLCDFSYIYFMLTMLFCGCATGIIQTFLFWHLQDIGGTQFLFSSIIALQCLSEVLVYCVSGSMILYFGHHRVLYAGLVCYAIRFFGYAYITNSWLVLPLEVLHGLTSASVWSAGVVFVGLIPGATTTMQGILGGVYFGLGNGGGGIIGGLIVSLIGCPHTFLILGIISIVDLFLFVIVNNGSIMTCNRKKSETDNDHRS